MAVIGVVVHHTTRCIWPPLGRRGLCFAALPAFNMRAYHDGGHETWEKRSGPWEMFLVESGIHPMGCEINHAQFMDAMKYLVGKKNKCFWKPLIGFGMPRNRIWVVLPVRGATILGTMG